MRQRPPRSTRTDTLLPYTTLFRSNQSLLEQLRIQFPQLRDEFYWQTRDALIGQGVLQAGKGRGGSVRRTDIEVPPASDWVQFLRSYGPSSSNLAMFDERSEERRVGKGCVSTCRSRWSPYH